MGILKRIFGIPKFGWVGSTENLSTMTINPDCPECRGTGQYHGLFVIEDCQTCKNGQRRGHTRWLVGTLLSTEVGPCGLGDKLTPGVESTENAYITSTSREFIDKFLGHPTVSAVTPNRREAFVVTTFTPLPREDWNADTKFWAKRLSDNIGQDFLICRRVTLAKP
jgi:hypothetical protein